jgi:hypothetical protein
MSPLLIALAGLKRWCAIEERAIDSRLDPLEVIHADPLARILQLVNSQALNAGVAVLDVISQ